MLTRSIQWGNLQLKFFDRRIPKILKTPIFGAVLPRRDQSFKANKGGLGITPTSIFIEFC